MEEFEKWNHIYRINDLRLSDKITTKHRKQERYKGWKAALKWVLEKIDKIYDGDFSNSEIVNTLKKELSK